MPLFVFLQRQKVSVHKAAMAAVLCMKMPPGCDRFALRQCLRRGCCYSPVWGSPTPPTVDRWRKDVKCEMRGKEHLALPSTRRDKPTHLSYDEDVRVHVEVLPLESPAEVAPPPPPHGRGLVGQCINRKHGPTLDPL